MTDPDHLTHFWGPTGVSAPRDRITRGRPARRRVRDRDGQRRRRERVPDPGRVRRGARARAAGVDRVALGHAGARRVRRRSARSAPRSGSIRPTCPRRSSAPEAQAGFLSSLDRFAAYLASLGAPVSSEAPAAPAAVVTADVAAEYLALADLLSDGRPQAWDAPSLCEGWRTREVVAHMTMPARYSGPAFMAELEAAGGDFTRLSNTVAARDGALPTDTLLADLRSDGAARVGAAGWRPGGRADPLRDPLARHRGGRAAGAAGARTHPSARCSTLVAADGRAEPVRGRPHRRGAAGGRPGLVLRLGCARSRARRRRWRSWPAAGCCRRADSAARRHRASRSPERLGQLARHEARRRRDASPRPRPAPPPRAGRPARWRRAWRPWWGSVPCAASTSHTVSTTPRFTSWRPSTAWCSRW